MCRADEDEHAAARLMHPGPKRRDGGGYETGITFLATLSDHHTCGARDQLSGGRHLAINLGLCPTKLCQRHYRRIGGVAALGFSQAHPASIAELGHAV